MNGSTLAMDSKAYRSACRSLKREYAFSAGISRNDSTTETSASKRQVGEVRQFLEHVLVHRVMQHPVRRPETEERDRRLHENALQNVAMHVVSEFVGQHRFDLFRRVVVEQRVGQNDAAGRAQSGKSRIRLLAFFRKLPAVDAAHPRPGALAQHHQAPPQVFIIERLELIEDGEEHDRRQLSQKDEQGP